jgi:iduronate 2-sulfatase
LLHHPQQPFREAIYTRFKEGDAIVTDQFIYTTYQKDGEMFFDLKNDPHENMNQVSSEERKDDVERLRGLLQHHQAIAARAKVAQPIARSSSSDSK